MLIFGAFFALLYFSTISECNSEDASQTLDSRIKNGNDVEPGQRYFQVSLQWYPKLEHFCGGAILTKEHVITAAHCTQKHAKGIKLEEIQVALGVSLEDPISIHRVTEIIRHPKYNLSNYVVNDIALLKVTPAFNLNDTIYSVALPPLNIDFPTGKKAVVSGWGSTTFPEPTWPTIMQQLTVTIINQSYCEELYNKISHNVHPEQLCTHENDENGKGHCIGDSGGPLTIDDNVLIGIVSWSKKEPTCGSHLYPNVYTRVSEYIFWIYENVNSNRRRISDNF